MIIDKSNVQILNTPEVHLHDDILHLFHFDRIKKELTLDLQRWDSKKEYKMKFENVLGFSMSSCDFWGESEYINGFVFIDSENEMLIQNLREKWNSTPNNPFEMCWEPFFETLFEFISGDTLRIVCEKIEII